MEHRTYETVTSLSKEDHTEEALCLITNMLEETTLPGVLEHIATALPTGKEGDVFTSDQWATLLSIFEVFFPNLPSNVTNKQNHNSKYSAAKAEILQYLAEDASPESVDQYLSTGFDRVALKEALRYRLINYVPQSQIDELVLVFSALNTRLGSYLMTGSITPLQNLSIEARTKVVCNWSASYLKPLRAVFSGMEVLAKMSWVQSSKHLLEVTGFPEVPPHAERSEGFKFEFKNFEDTPENTIIDLDFDVVIVGSGCGAGVAASHLARAAAKMPEGKRPKIAVLEKSYHYPATHFPMNTSASNSNLMEAGGGLQADDGSIALIAGSVWGGGGLINWSASLQPQSFVRDEWTNKDGLNMFSTPEFQDCLDTVCERMGVCKMTDEAGKAQIPHNFANETLLEGARRLGLAAEVVPQNSAGKAHQCSHCSEGCASATKQGPTNCWLPDAAKYGTEFIEGCFVEEITWDPNISSNRPRRAAGLKAEWTSRDRKSKRTLRIKAKRIIVSAGTLQSPALLIRSGITNRHVGANLHLHPTMAVGAIWSKRANPWEGPILTAAVTSHENFDHEGHGPKVEIIAGTVKWMLPWQPWNPDVTLTALKSSQSDTKDEDVFSSLLDYKVQAAKFGYSTGMISIQRDRDTGRVYLDPKDPSRRQVRFKYNASQRDRAGILEGVILAARMAYVMGAKEVRPAVSKIPPFVRSQAASTSTNDEAFALWLQEVRQAWNDFPEYVKMGSAHQMGTCRMSANKDEGVIDSSGKVWEHEGVYVADASTFPSASGVNPMVTTMGIAEWISRGIVKELEQELL